MERESFSFTRGSRAIGKELGVSHVTVQAWAKARALPIVMLAGRWTLLPAVPAYTAALAQILLRRERSLTDAPRGGGLMPGSGSAASTPPRCKKMTPKRFAEEEVVTI